MVHGPTDLTNLSWCKAQTSFSDCPPCMSVNFSHFDLLQNQWASLFKFGTKHPWVKGIQLYSNEGPLPFSRGDNKEIAKIHWWTLKILFSRITGPISTKLGTRHLWVKKTQDCSIEGPRSFSRGDNNELAKILLWNTKSSSPEPLVEFQPNLVQDILGWRGLKIFQMKGHALF